MKPENLASGGNDGGIFPPADLIKFYFLLDPQQNSRLLWIAHEVCLVEFLGEMCSLSQNNWI